MASSVEDVLDEYASVYAAFGFDRKSFAKALSKMDADPDRLADALKEFRIRVSESDPVDGQVAMLGKLRWAGAQLNGDRVTQAEARAARLFGTAAEDLGVTKLIKWIDVIAPRQRQR